MNVVLMMDQCIDAQWYTLVILEELHSLFWPAIDRLSWMNCLKGTYLSTTNNYWKKYCLPSSHSQATDSSENYSIKGIRLYFSLFSQWTPQDYFMPCVHAQTHARMHGHHFEPYQTPQRICGVERNLKCSHTSPPFSRCCHTHIKLGAQLPGYSSSEDGMSMMGLAQRWAWLKSWWSFHSAQPYNGEENLSDN